MEMGFDYVTFYEGMHFYQLVSNVFQCLNYAFSYHQSDFFCKISCSMEIYFYSLSSLENVYHHIHHKNDFFDIPSPFLDCGFCYMNAYHMVSNSLTSFCAQETNFCCMASFYRIYFFYKIYSCFLNFLLHHYYEIFCHKTNFYSKTSAFFYFYYGISYQEIYSK